MARGVPLSSTGCWRGTELQVAQGAATVQEERLFMVGPSPYKRYSFAELRAVIGPLWVRCDSCRRFRSLRITRALRDRDYRTTRFTCRRCGRQGHCTLDRPDQEKGMEDYALDHGPTGFEQISADARRTPVGQLFVPDKLRWKPTR